jgi:uncharacterized protein (TIGR02246 family)
MSLLKNIATCPEEFAMRRKFGRFTLAFIVIASSFTYAETPKASREKDEAEIRSAIDAYVKAYNASDAQAVANLWSEEGEWVSPQGERLHTRKAIAAELAQMFKLAPKLSIEIAKPSIRFITNDVAIEEGHVTVFNAGEITSEATYTAIHVKRDGQWQLDSVRETEIPDLIAAPEQLQDLAWLVGEWVDQAEDSLVETKVTWTKNKRFLSCNFRVSLPNLEPLEGIQIIGWDAASGAIRSWVFDSSGTIGEGVWSHDGNHWIVKSSQVLADGSRASATNIYEIQDENSYKWKSIGRSVGDQFLPNIEEVLVVRKSAVPAAMEPASKSKSSSEAVETNKKKSQE